MMMPETSSIQLHRSLHLEGPELSTPIGVILGFYWGYMGIMEKKKDYYHGLYRLIGFRALGFLGVWYPLRVILGYPIGFRV